MASIVNKTQHIFSRLGSGMRRGAQIGAVGGVLFGLAAVVTGGASLLAIAGYGLIGIVAGMIPGGLIGGARGVFTRTMPDGEQVIKQAEACAQEKVEKAKAPAEAMALEMLEEKNIAPETAAGGIPREAVEELKAMTAALNQIQANAATAAQATETPQAWQSRIAQEPMADRQRG